MTKPYDTFGPIQPPPAYSDEWAARRRVAEQLRILSEQVITRKSSAPQLAALEAQLQQASVTLASCDILAGRSAWVADGTEHHGHMGVLSREITPMAGNSNATAPPMRAWFEGDTAHARVTAGWLYEGPPQCVHGGIIAALFDDFMGCAQLLTGQAGATGHITIRYHRPTPIGVELHMIAKIESVNGRKIVVAGEMRANDVVTATAEGLFIAIREGVTNLASRESGQT